MNLFAVIVAAGSGLRMGNPLPKQFIPLLGKPVLLHSVELFLETYPGIKLIVVTHADHLDQTEAILHGLGAQVIPGAATRSGSVMAGLALVPDEAIVFIHDAVRCLCTPALLRRCHDTTVEKGNAIPAVLPVDSLRLLDGDSSRVIDRNAVRMIQTPQTFRTTELKRAYERAGDTLFTDDAAVAESFGIRLHLVEGEQSNIKITHPADFLIAETILRARAATSSED